MTTATFNITGMHCASCAVRNERTLKKLKGADFDREYLRMMVEGHDKELAMSDPFISWGRRVSRYHASSASWEEPSTCSPTIVI